jgi:rubrerythrin
MARYDVPHKVKTTVAGVISETIIKNCAAEEFEWYLDRKDIYEAFVRCRKCKCSHNVNEKCPVCDLETKLPKRN